MKYFMLICSTIATVAIVGGAALSPSQADWISNEITGAVGEVEKKRKVPILRYQSTVREDGTIKVLLDESADTSDVIAPDVMTIFAPNVRATEKLLHTQDWYMTVGPNGDMLGIYTTPRDTALPSNVLRRLGEGYGILKVDPRSSFFKVFPSKHQLEIQLNSFTEAARTSVCANESRPETLSTTMDVRPGWSGSGRITFNATWNVSDLCKQPKS